MGGGAELTPRVQDRGPNSEKVSKPHKPFAIVSLPIMPLCLTRSKWPIKKAPSQKRCCAQEVAGVPTQSNDRLLTQHSTRRVLNLRFLLATLLLSTYKLRQAQTSVLDAATLQASLSSTVSLVFMPSAAQREDSLITIIIKKFNDFMSSVEN